MPGSTKKATIKKVANVAKVAKKRVTAKEAGTRSAANRSANARKLTPAANAKSVKSAKKARNARSTAEPQKLQTQNLQKSSPGHPASTTRKTGARPRAAAGAPHARRPAGQTTILHSLHALLETVRTIAQYEDQLCTLTHEARTEGALGAGAQEELHALLLELPSSVYHAELDAVHEALHNLASGDTAHPNAKA